VERSGTGVPPPASFSTTEGYIHKDRDQQHQETEKHTLTDAPS
jgi:hypothetical protein